MQDLKEKRAAIERGHMQPWRHRGRGSFHFENIETLGKILSAALILTGLMKRGKRNACSPVVRNIRFEFANLPPAFSGLRIMHLSDLHADSVPEFADQVSPKLDGLKADICVLTGDYRFHLSGPSNAIHAPMRRILSSVHASQGVYAILGNHDCADVAATFETMGVRMLMNEAVEIRRNGESIWLAGLDDPHYYGCDDLPAALRPVGRDEFKILLVHTPELLEEADTTMVSLYLCGHTHAGQIRIPGIGPLYVNAHCPRRYTHGQWQYRRVQGYTSAGLGTSLVPVRFFCPPEIGMIELFRSM